MQVQMTTGAVTGWSPERAESAKAFCTRFMEAPVPRRFIFGRNVYSASVLQHLDVAGVIDDFTEDREYCGTPVVRTAEIVDDALVLAASGGQPLTVARILDDRCITHLDYFAFLKFSGLPLKDVVFNEGFRTAVDGQPKRLEWARGLLQDDLSREAFDKLVAFRSSLDVSHLHGFTDRQKEQYFEPFLPLPEGSVFWDVGGFDGFTTQEFARRCPDYASVRIFEPNPDNQKVCLAAARGLHDVAVMPFGAGEEAGIVRFSSDGSTSAMTDDGDLSIEIRRLDDFRDPPASFLKMDVEGAEIGALRGARQLISENHPSLAVSVYHHPSDFWEVPGYVLGVRPDYRVYLRHYTESIYETVMYFVPA